MKRTALTVIKPTVIKPDKDAVAIGELYRKARLSLIESVRYAHACGERLIAKKATLGHGQWLPWLAANADVLGFDNRRTASRLMALAANGALASHLDEATAITYNRQLWGHADEQDSEDNDPDEIDLDSLLRDDAGELTPKARAFIREVRAEKVAEKKLIRHERERVLGAKQLAWPTDIYGVIYADPATRFKTWSEAGMLLSADNHYPTEEDDAIFAYADKIKAISARDCVLFLWATVPKKAVSIDVMRAWGFEYKSNVDWVKPKPIHGYIFRNQHEHLLYGTRGKPPAPAMGDQWPSVIFAPRGKHSEKPEIFYELIEDYFPNLPKIELYARRRRKGWDSWGTLEFDEAAE
jgi:N6-adenosine-specific RNA methylase IME4